MTPFDFINNISSSRDYIWDDSISEKEYNSFMVNRGLSQFRDTVLFAQEMNQRGQYISPKAQYDFYFYGITNKKKRFAKWFKPGKLENVELLSNHFGINKTVMENYMSLMTEKELENILLSLEKGGRHGKS